LSKRARRRQKRPNPVAKALTSSLYRPKVEIDRRKAARLIRSAKHKTKLDHEQ
jgi:stalled ribosome alternative rescue factor ArfA